MAGGGGGGGAGAPENPGIGGGGGGPPEENPGIDGGGGGGGAELLKPNIAGGGGGGGGDGGPPNPAIGCGGGGISKHRNSLARCKRHGTQGTYLDWEVAVHPLVAVAAVQGLGAAVVSEGPVAVDPCLVAAAADSAVPGTAVLGTAGEQQTWDPLGCGPPAVSLVATVVQLATVVVVA